MAIVTDLTNCRLLHGCMQTKANSSAFVGAVHNVETGVSSLYIQRNPVRPFWVTKPALRNYKNKRLCSPLTELDQYQAPEHELGPAIAKALGYRSTNNIYLRRILDNQYVYGADIPFSVILRRQLINATPATPRRIRVGALDLETSMLGGQEIILGTYVSPEGKAWCGILGSFLGNTSTEELQEKFAAKVSEMGSKMLSSARGNGPREIFAAINWQVEFKVHRSERDLILWLLAVLHADKPDFCAVWNIAFDIPYMLDRMPLVGIDPHMAFPHPDIPKDLRMIQWRQDKRKKIEHPADRWHWFTVPGYTQFVDTMALYSRLRRAAGRLISYKLDYIAKENLGVGKIELGTSGTHQYMQQHHFPDYAVYNVFDTILTIMLELLNNDVSQMVHLAGVSDLSSFAMQTRQLQNQFFAHGLDTQPSVVPCSVGSELTTEWDDLISNIGGGVLSPGLARNVGINSLRELPRQSGVTKFVADADGASLYPSLVENFNIDRDTRRGTVLTAEDMTPSQLENLFTNAASPEATAVYLGVSYFGLPTYAEMLALVESQEHATVPT